MAIAGLWRANQANPAAYATALKQGDGVNNIHGSYGGPGRSIAPTPSEPLQSSELIDEFQAETFDYDETWNTSILWGYGEDTGTAERVDWETDAPAQRAIPDSYPAYGEYRAGLPGGTQVRTIDLGADNQTISKLMTEDDAAQGWLNKVSGDQEISPGVSDPSQYEMQTSMVQRFKTRTGTQTPTGREDDHTAPIESRVLGMRERIFAAPDSTRHVDMLPKEQEVMIRPFWQRTAGTGYREWMMPNSMTTQEPITRKPPDDPYPGPDSTGPESPYVDANAGFVAEDYTW